MPQRSKAPLGMAARENTAQNPANQGHQGASKAKSNVGMIGERVRDGRGDSEDEGEAGDLDKARALPWFLMVRSVHRLISRNFADAPPPLFSPLPTASSSSRSSGVVGDVVVAAN